MRLNVDNPELLCQLPNIRFPHRALKYVTILFAEGYDPLHFGQEIATLRWSWT